MKTLFKKLENAFAAAAFAESGEHETARRILSENAGDRKSSRASAKVRKRPASRPTLRAD